MYSSDEHGLNKMCCRNANGPVIRDHKDDKLGDGAPKKIGLLPENFSDK